MTKQYIEEFKVAQEEWKQKEKEAMEEENRKIMEFAKVQKAREEAQKLEKQARYGGFVFSLLFSNMVLYECANVPS